MRKSKTDNDFSFQLKNPSRLLNECLVGEEINWWQPESKDKLLFYKKGYVGGNGKLGEASVKVVSLVNKIFQEGGQINFSVVGSTIIAQVLTESEVQLLRIAKNDKKALELEEKLNRKYKPRKSYQSIRVQHDLWKVIPKSTAVAADIKSNEYYISNPDNIFIDFVLSTGEVIRKDNEEDKLIKLIRARNSGYELEVNVEGCQYSNIDFIIIFK